MASARFLRPMLTMASAAGATYYGCQQFASPIRLDAKYNVNTPGLYIWGSNAGRVANPESIDPTIKTPYRIPYFDGKILRHLALSEKTGLAVLDNGDVVQWGNGGSLPNVVLKGKDISKVCVCGNGTGFALSKNGQQVYAWNTLDPQFSHQPGSWWKFWGSGDSTGPVVEFPELSMFERINDIDAGDEHLVALTSKGRVFTGAAGNVSVSKGQFGIASYSQFEEPPKDGKLHEVKLIKKLSAPVEQVASGSNHVVVRTTDGRLYGFGENIYGQLATSFGQRTANVAVPSEIPLTKFLSNSYYKRVNHIAAGGDITYVSVVGEGDKVEHFSFGNGLSGQLGTGSFAHAQSTPVRMKFFDDMAEYSESLKKMVPIPLSGWSVGKTHSAVSLSSEDTTDLLVWGGNQSCQLGTGKKNTISKPITILPLDVSREENNNEGNANLLRLQLFKNHPLKFKTPQGKSQKATVNQVFCAGEKVSAVYYTK